MLHPPIEPRRKAEPARPPSDGALEMSGSITSTLRERIRLSLEKQGYQIVKSRITAIWVNQSNRTFSLTEGKSSVAGEHVMAIMKGPDAFLVITRSRGGAGGDPYLFGLDQAEELKRLA
ncbi:MAG TPA: hypothetical protein VGK61_01405 [Planctomycetota bacterium]|jgi:hypothetical protein